MMPWSLLLPLGLLLAFAGWLRWAYAQAPPELRGWLLPALGWRLAITAAAAHWPSQDAIQAHRQGNFFAARLIAQPGQALALLQQPRVYESLTGAGREAYLWSQTIFFNKLVALVALCSGGVLWLSVLCLSLGCFVGCWSLVVALRRTLPQAALAASILAFLLWPTVLWWTAGLNKETVLVATSTGVVALGLPWLYGSPQLPRSSWLKWLWHLLLGLLLAWVMTRVRYFFALPLLGGLLALAGVRAATRRGWLGTGWLAQLGGLLVGLLLLLGVARVLVGYLLTATYFLGEVSTIYHHGLETSADRPHVEYAHWQPTVPNLLAHVPLAVAAVITRPWPGETMRSAYAVAGLENTSLTILVVLAVLAVVRGRPGPLPVALVAALLIYCLLIAAFIGLSTPNLGTISRYRAVVLPWLLWLVLVTISQWVKSAWPKTNPQTDLN